MTARLGNRLKRWRTRHDLTQHELAGLAGVSRKTINTLERGAYNPSTLLALTLARILDTHVEDLFYLEPASSPDTAGDSSGRQSA